MNKQIKIGCIALAALSLAFAACTSEGAGSMNASAPESDTLQVAECDSTTKLGTDEYCRDGKVVIIREEACDAAGPLAIPEGFTEKCSDPCDGGRGGCQKLDINDPTWSLVVVYCGDTLITYGAPKCNAGY